MKIFVKVRIKILILISMCICIRGYNQVPTYIIDQSFDTHEIFKSPTSINDFYLLEDGRILVGGAFNSDIVNGFGMIYSNGQLDNNWGGYEYYGSLDIIAQEDGYVYPTIYSYGKLLLDGTPWHVAYNDSWSEYLSGGTFNPYNVQRVWDIYQMENGDLLLGGAIANDTLLPNELRGISRIHADGSHDPTFPVLNITPNNAGGAVREIFSAPDSSWYISGSFTAINGHETNHIAHLYSNFSVDTTFVSPFLWDGFGGPNEDIILVDSQSRVWVSGYQMRLQENPYDTIQIIRLSSQGEVDTTFQPRKIENVYPPNYSLAPSLAFFAKEMEAHPGNYLIYGSFSRFNDTIQSCMTIVNDVGTIQNNFFQGQGATDYNVNNIQNYINTPAITKIQELEDGSLLIGGGFSEFMGETRYSMVKLKQGFVGIEEPNQKIDLNLYPNPTTEKLNVSLESAFAKSGVIYNAMGMQVLTFQFKNQETQVDITTLQPGIYFVKVQLETGQVGVRKFVKIK